MSDLLNYLRAQTERDAAKQQYNYAGCNLTLKQIHARLAELKSQHEPLNSLCDGDPVMRRKVYDAAFYVVLGRWRADEDIIDDTWTDTEIENLRNAGILEPK